MTNPGSDDLAGCGKTVPCCHSERSEEYRPAHFHEHTRFFVVPQGGTPQNDSPEAFFRSLPEGSARG